MKNLALLGLAAALLVGCASTGPSDNVEKTVFSGFVEKSDGSVYQSVMGVTCPAEIGGMSLNDNRVYNENGTDLSCNYANGETYFTFYLSRYTDFNLGPYFHDARAAMESRLLSNGFVFDETLSEACANTSLDAASVMSGFAGILSGKNTSNEITIGTSLSAVYVAEDRMSLVIVDEPFPKEFFKTRYTGGFNGEESVKAACQLARDNYLAITSGVKKDRGMEVTEGDKILQLLKNNDSQ